jgi:DNA polymerase/3'-5' exonuclease PolX
VAYTFEELKAKTLADLREIAKGLDSEAVKGWSQMNKDHLLPAIAKALNIDTHKHAHVEGIDKASLKAKLRELKAAREQAKAAGDSARLKAIRRQHHHLNRQIRAHTVIDA